MLPHLPLRQRNPDGSFTNNPPPPGPVYDDDGDLLYIMGEWASRRVPWLGDGTYYVPTVQHTWGEPRLDDIQSIDDLPRYVRSYLTEFAVWMQRDDGLYEAGFRSPDGRFFRNRVVDGFRWEPRPFEEVPEGRAFPAVGASARYDLESRAGVKYGRVRGGYAVPGILVVDDPETPEVENIFVTFEGYPHLR